MASFLEYDSDDLTGYRACFFGPAYKTLRRPVAIVPMGFRSMRIKAGMVSFQPGSQVTGNTLTLIKHFDGVFSDAGIQLLLDQTIGNRVVMPLDVHMVVNGSTGSPQVCTRTSFHFA